MSRYNESTNCHYKSESKYVSRTETKNNIDVTVSSPFESTSICPPNKSSKKDTGKVPLLQQNYKEKVTSSMEVSRIHRISNLLDHIFAKKIDQIHSNLASKNISSTYIKEKRSMEVEKICKNSRESQIPFKLLNILEIENKKSVGSSQIEGRYKSRQSYKINLTSKR